MNQTTKWVVGIIIAIVVIAVGYSIYNKPNLNEPIKIGFIGPLTGDVASYGESEKNVIEFALQEINQSGGVLGRKVEVIYEDGKCNGQDAATGAQKLVNVDKVKIIFGGGCSGEMLAAAPITQPAKVILFSSFASNPAISKLGDFIFRNVMTDKDVAEGMAILPYKEGHKKVAILSENTDFGKGVRENIIGKLNELNVKIVADEFYNQGARDFRTQLLKIKSTKPDALIFNSQSGPTGGLAVKQAKELGLNVVYYGGYVFSGSDALNAGGAALNGMKFVTGGVDLSKNNSKAQEFLTNYLKQYPKPANDYVAGLRYDSVYIIKKAIESCRDVNTECINNYLHNMPDYDGTVGKYHFDKNGDEVGLSTFVVGRIIDAEKGKVEELE